MYEVDLDLRTCSRELKFASITSGTRIILSHTSSYRSYPFTNGDPEKQLSFETSGRVCIAEILYNHCIEGIVAALLALSAARKEILQGSNFYYPNLF